MDDNTKYVKKIAIIAHQAFSLYNFRGALIQELTSKGFVVYALAPDYDYEMKCKVTSLGAIPFDYSLERTGMHPGRDFHDLLKLILLVHRLKVDISFSYSIKPVIYGSFAARISGIKRVFSMVEGLGHVFIEDGEQGKLKKNILIDLVLAMYKIAFRCSTKVFFLNPDDAYYFISRGLIGKKKTALIPGIGVNLKHFVPAPFPDNVVFLLIARLIREKGIYEYIQAIRLIKMEYHDVEFLLVGDVDSNPSSITREEADSWVADGLVEWPGAVADVRPWIARSSVFVLPSYREGVPRSTQEAMAMGRAVVTTNVPGCRETVDEGENGFMVPARDAFSLKEAMCRFIRDSSLIKKMGMKSRIKCEDTFNEKDINKKILDIIED